MNDAEFDRALGVWEDGQLNRYLAEGAAWEEAYDEARDAIWGMKLADIYDMKLPIGTAQKIEALVEVTAGVILEGR